MTCMTRCVCAGGKIRFSEMGDSEKKSKISYVNANVTSIISVALVLLLLGIGAMLGLFARGATERIQASIGFDVSMSDTASDSQILAMKRALSAAPYTASVRYISKEEALSYWQQETGEDLMQVLGFNPLSNTEAKRAAITPFIILLTTMGRRMNPGVAPTSFIV